VSKWANSKDTIKRQQWSNHLWLTRQKYDTKRRK